MYGNKTSSAFLTWAKLILTQPCCS